MLLLGPNRVHRLGRWEHCPPRSQWVEVARSVWHVHDVQRPIAIQTPRPTLTVDAAGHSGGPRITVTCPAGAEKPNRHSADRTAAVASHLPSSCLLGTHTMTIRLVLPMISRALSSERICRGTNLRFMVLGKCACELVGATAVCYGRSCGGLRVEHIMVSRAASRRTVVDDGHCHQ